MKHYYVTGYFNKHQHYKKQLSFFQVLIQIIKLKKELKISRG